MLLVIPLALKAHELWLSAPSQPVVVVQYLEYRCLELGELGEEACEDGCLMAIHLFKVKAIHVPRHIKECLHAQFHRLDITHVEQPVTVGTVVIGFLQLLVHQHRMRGVEPQIVVGGSQIGQMVVDTSAS